jgi:hypothetical protein
MTPIEKYWHGEEYHDCDRLGIIIKRADTVDVHAHCVVVHLLTRQENMGNHNLYMDVIDSNNKRLDGSILKGRNNNINLSARIDKPPNEFGTNFAMYNQDTLSCWVDEVPGLGRIPSDVISGFSTRWGGPIVGNQDYGHISYYVIWQVGTGSIVEPPEPPIDDCIQLAKDYLTLQGKYDKLVANIRELVK